MKSNFELNVLKLFLALKTTRINGNEYYEHCHPYDLFGGVNGLIAFLCAISMHIFPIIISTTRDKETFANDYVPNRTTMAYQNESFHTLAIV